MEVYVVDGKGIDYTKYLISEIKKLNPKVDIRATWVDVNHEAKDIKVYSSIELGKLRIPDGYFSNVLEEHILVPIMEYRRNKEKNPEEEYKNEDFLNFEISEKQAIDFAIDVQRVNSVAIILLGYDKERQTAKIKSSGSLDYLQFPYGNFGYGIDKNGYVGKLVNKRKEFFAVESTELSIDKKESEKHFEFIEKNVCFYYDVSLEEQLAYAGAPYDVIAKKFNFIAPHVAKATYEQQQVKVKDVELAKDITQEEPKIVEPTIDSTQEEPRIVEPTIDSTEEEPKSDDKADNKRLKIIKREETKDGLNHAKNRAAFIAGFCILGSLAANVLIGEDLNQQIQEKLSTLTSWNGLDHLIQGTNPVANFLSVGAAAFIARYGLKNKKLNDLENYIDENPKSMGGM